MFRVISIIILVSSFHTSFADLAEECGRSQSSEKIANATTPKPTRFPWVVFITFDSSFINSFVGVFSQKKEECEAVFVSKSELQFRQECIATGWKKNLKVKISLGSIVRTRKIGKQREYISMMTRQIESINCKNSVCLLKFDEPMISVSLIEPICTPSKEQIKNASKVAKMVKLHWKNQKNEYFNEEYLHLKQFPINSRDVEALIAGEKADESQFKTGDIIMYEDNGKWYLKGFVTMKGVFKKTYHLISHEKA